VATLPPTFTRGGQDAGEGHRRHTRAGQIFNFFAGEILHVAGEVLSSVRPTIGLEIAREPVGIITRWNFSVAIAAWEVTPALFLLKSAIQRLAFVSLGA
jgi:alpha-ketoglutaric semialdehyde dehydrogenase